MTSTRTLHRLNELEAQNAALLARVLALETALAAWLPPAPEEAEQRILVPATVCQHCGTAYTLAPDRLPPLCPVCGHYPDQSEINCSCPAHQRAAFLIDAPHNRSRARRIAGGGER